MNKGNILWVFVGLVAVMGGSWVLIKLFKPMSSSEAIAVIAKHLGKDPAQFAKNIRLYQDILSREGRTDFGVDNDFLINRAQALLDEVEIFTWKSGKYNSKTGKRA